MLLVTLPNVFTDRLSNKPFLIWLLTTAPHLKYIATLLCNLSLIASFLTWMSHQGSVERYTSDGTFNKPLFCKFTKESTSKKIWKLVKILQNYEHEFVASLIWPTLYTHNWTFFKTMSCSHAMLFQKISSAFASVWMHWELHFGSEISACAREFLKAIDMTTDKKGCSAAAKLSKRLRILITRYALYLQWTRRCPPPRNKKKLKTFYYTNCYP